MTDLNEPRYMKFRDYWNRYPKGSPTKEFDAIQFVSYCDIEPNDTIIEIGMGGGQTCVLIADRTNHCIFMDFNWNAVITQKEKNRNLKIVNGDGIKTPFRSRSFSKILVRNVIHNFPGNVFRTQFYEESSRIIKNNGELIFGLIPNQIGTYFELENYINPKWWHRLRRKHGTWWPISIREMKKELCGLGFEFVHIRKTPEPTKKNVYYQLRQLVRRFFLPVFFNNPIIYSHIDIKFKKVRDNNILNQ